MPRKSGGGKTPSNGSPKQPAASGRTPRAAALEAKARLAATSCGKTAIEQPYVHGNGGQTPTLKARSRSAAADQPLVRPGTAPKAAAAVRGGGVRKKTRGRAAGAKYERPVLSMELDGIEYHVGDDVYVAFDNYESEDEEDEECEVCHRANAQATMLECNSCLRGFHMRCLKPPLRAVPDGDWLCPSCDRGEARKAPSRLVSRWSRFLFGTDQLGLARIEGFGHGKDLEGNEETQWRCRYYRRPEETHIGRQKHHGSREVFLSNKIFNEPTYSIVGHAYVMSPEAFASGPSCPEDDEKFGMDVFLCEYEYDENWRRFRRRVYADEEGGEDGTAAARGADSDWSAGSDSDGEADDAYQPSADQLPRWGKQGPGPRRRHGTLGSLAGGAEAAQQAFDGLGATAVPDRARVPLSDPFAEVHARLSVTAPPATLPCRDAEKEKLTQFVDKAIEGDAGSGILYMCGVPGTGKTASVNEALLAARGRARAAGAQFVVINCLQLPTPQHVYSKLWECLSGQRLPPLRARDALEELIRGAGSGRRRYSTVVMLDEIDMLMTRDQQVLYNLFEWPAQSGARLAVIAISNTHDLDSRVLPRIASRLSEAKLVYQPYNMDQLKTIVRDRLEGITLVDSLAIDQVARKVAAETGDVRRALELLRRAVEIARAEHKAARRPGARAGSSSQPQGGRAAGAGPSSQAAATGAVGAGQVTRMHAATAINEMFSAVHMQLLLGCSLFEKLMLVGVILEARASGKSSVVLQAVLERLNSHVCPMVELQLPCPGMMQHVTSKLAAMRLLLADAYHIKAQLMLNVGKDDVAIVVKDDRRLERLHGLM